MFKEMFLETVKRGTINEGTQCTITVKVGDTYKTSICQYDGYDRHMLPELRKYWNNIDKAKKLVTNSGEIASVNNGEVRYYEDRTLLKITKNGAQATKNTHQSRNAYYFNGKEWLDVWNNDKPLDLL